MDIWGAKKIRGPRNMFYSIVRMLGGSGGMGPQENFEKYLL